MGSDKQLHIVCLGQANDSSPQCRHGFIMKTIVYLVYHGHTSLELINKDDDRVVTVELTKKGKILKEEVTHIPIDVYKLCKTDEVDLINLKQQLDKLLNILD